MRVEDYEIICALRRIADALEEQNRVVKQTSADAKAFNDTLLQAQARTVAAQEPAAEAMQERLVKGKIPS